MPRPNRSASAAGAKRRRPERLPLPPPVTLTPDNVDCLLKMSFHELWSVWAHNMGRAKCPAQKSLVIREMAWRVQERVFGGLDAETKRLLARAIREAKAEAARRMRGAGESDRSGGGAGQAKGTGVSVGPTRRRLPRPSLPTSSRLVRVWGGRVHEVHVLETGKRFSYQNKEYRSLTEIARAITGTNWSGPRFFGLRSARPLRTEQHDGRSRETAGGAT